MSEVRYIIILALRAASLSLYTILSELNECQTVNKEKPLHNF